MEAASVKQLRGELNNKSPKELVEICLRLSKFKKENKELLTYLLFEAENEFEYIKLVKQDIVKSFDEIAPNSFYTLKKNIRKILRNTKKQIRYSGKKETEIELLLFFCDTFQTKTPGITRSLTLTKIYVMQLEMTERKLKYLHPDLQHDYRNEIELLRDRIAI